MQQLVIASNNSGKIREIMQMLSGMEVLSLKDIGFYTEIPEPYHTFEENALAKAKAVYEFANKACFADDSGLCIQVLGGAPGVDSAHYAGSRNDEDNVQKVLAQLQGNEERRAYYKAVICLIWDGATYYFDGYCHGQITKQKSGNGGFGYDPIFIPEGFQNTFAELSPEIKNSISHRGEAVRKMVSFLNSRNS